MLLGINTVVFGASTLEEALQHIEWAGYEHVELAAILGMVEHVKIGDDVEKIRELLASHNLKPTAMEAATTDLERLKGLFRLAKGIGFDRVNIGSSGVSGDEESTVAAINEIREIAKAAADEGVVLGVKPHVGNAIYNAETGLRLLNEVTEGSYGLNFDPSHLARANDDPAEVAPRWGSRIVTSHFRDCPVRVPGPPGSPEQQTPGRGALDLPGILRALKATGYAGPVNLEVIGSHEYPVSRAMGIAAQAKGYLNRCFQEIA